jgi:hypothetical protein
MNLSGNIESIQSKLKDVQNSLDELKTELSVKNSESEPMVEAEPEKFVAEGIEVKSETSKSMPNPLLQDKDTKYEPGVPGRVKLSFPRIIMLIDSNKTDNTIKNWKLIKEKLLNATNKNDVQTIIKENQIRFSANSIGGTRKKRRGGKRSRTHKRY